MALRRTITSEQAPALGEAASIVFGVGGGSIGRAHDNDWVLPDPQRYVSAHHARVHFRNGQYLLEDCSSNGVYINDAPEPVRRRGLIALHDGDTLRLGAYRISAAVDGTGPIPTVEASSVFPVAPISASGSAGPFPQPAPALDVSELLVLERSSSQSARLRKPDAYGQILPIEDSGLRNFDLNQAQRQEPATSPDLRRDALELKRDISRPINLALVEAGTALEQFCRGAGIAADTLPQGAQARLLFLGGLLLREALVGLKDLTLAQQDIRSGLKVPVPENDATARIALRTVAVEDLLQRLLAGHDQHEIDAVQWLRDTIANARRHDAATAVALSTALAEFIPHLRPDAGSGPATLARFRSITENPRGGLPHLYLEAFVRAFLAACEPGATPR
ncbi:MAG: type VI secretion system-associated FHA domain protein TagH [Gammaproteobacteria bacterium]|nr:type VI secretion system-associated FHA domain protein TagH [Gammaproteobacteria bacterium]